MFRSIWSKYGSVVSAVWKNKDIFIRSKAVRQTIEELVWSIAIYGYDGWTLLSKDQKYIEVFEMWCYTEDC